MKRSIMHYGVDESRLVQSLYRPFDLRWTYYTPKSKGFIAWPVYDVMRHMLTGKNRALILPRRVETAGDWHHVTAAKHTIDHVVLSLKTIDSLFPLYLYSEAEGDLNLHGTDPRPNFSSSFLESLALALKVSQAGAHGLPAGLSPEDIFHYIYAVFHSPGYRTRYTEFLKIDFPRLPLTGDLELFRSLAELGGEIVALHLLESPTLDQPITQFIGNRNPGVEKPTWSKGTVWVDKRQTTGFKGVPEAVWNFHIGGYQVCHKWLKDRKGRTLSDEDIAHYHKIVVALNETIRLMREIDAVIDEHGGWPDAFAVDTGAKHKDRHQ